MDTTHIQLKVWTARPSELLCEVIHQHNGLFVIFLRLTEAQNSALEGVAAHLGLRYERCQLDHLYDTRWHPNNNPHDMGTHDAEIDMWEFLSAAYPRQYIVLDQNPRTVQENSPKEALKNRVLGIREILDALSAIPVEQRRPEDIKLIAHNEGYLERVRQEFPHL